jgi:hypothetical protein
MFRRVMAVLGVTAILMVGAVPVLADPPPESGVVVRPSGDGGFGALLNDDENGYFVFVNITREGFCEWLAGDRAGPPPTLSDYDVQLVTGKKTGSNLNASGLAPTALHALRTGASFDDGPCEGSEEGPTFVGEIRDRANENGNTGIAAYSGVGTVYDVESGAPYFYSYKVNIFWQSDKIVAQQYNLHPIGK